MSAPERLRLVVLFGGQSAEHEVSCVSAFHVLRAVDPRRYEIDAIGITKSGDSLLLSGGATGEDEEEASERSAPRRPLEIPHRELLWLKGEMGQPGSFANRPAPPRAASEPATGRR